jgi:hypothetical protein
MPEPAVRAESAHFSPRVRSVTSFFRERLKMNSKRRAELIIETHEVWVVRRRAGKTAVAAAALLCGECANEGRMLAPEDAARLAGVSPRVIYRALESGRLHFAERTDGSLFVCLTSVLAGAC